MTVAAKESTHLLQHTTEHDIRGVPLLPECALGHILSFADIPTIGACACVSKLLNKVASQGCVWSGHLLILLKKFYRCYYHEVPILERALKSTQFLAFYKDLMKSKYHKPIASFMSPLLNYIRYVAQNDGKAEGVDWLRDATWENHARWLLEDVSLQEYYKQLGSCALCTFRFFRVWHKSAVNSLPVIRLFQKLPEMYTRGNDEALAWVNKQWEDCASIRGDSVPFQHPISMSRFCHDKYYD